MPVRRTSRLLVSRSAACPSMSSTWPKSPASWGRFRPSLVADAAGVDRSAAEHAVRVMTGAGLARGLDGGYVEFVHPLFAKALYDDIPGLHLRPTSRPGYAGLDLDWSGPHLWLPPTPEPDIWSATVTRSSALEAAGRAALLLGGLESAMVDFRAAGHGWHQGFIAVAHHPGQHRGRRRQRRARRRGVPTATRPPPRNLSCNPRRLRSSPEQRSRRAGPMRWSGTSRLPPRPRAATPLNRGPS